MNRNESLARDIYEWCKSKDVWMDCIIYFNGKAWSSSKTWGGENGVEIDNELYEYAERNPLDFVEYANTETITMTFEGGLYHILNGYTAGWIKLEDEFKNIFEKYGFYSEMGYAWSLAAYEL